MRLFIWPHGFTIRTRKMRSNSIARLTFRASPESPPQRGRPGCNAALFSSVQSSSTGEQRTAEPRLERPTADRRAAFMGDRAAAEEGLESLAGNMRVSVVRPPIVYGAGAKGNFKLLAGAVLRGVPLPFASIRNRRAFMSVENCSIVHSAKTFAGLFKDLMSFWLLTRGAVSDA